MFLLFSFDSLLSRGSRGVFTGSLARSSLALRLIKCFKEFNNNVIYAAGVNGFE